MDEVVYHNRMFTINYLTVCAIILCVLVAFLAISFVIDKKDASEKRKKIARRVNIAFVVFALLSFAFVISGAIMFSESGEIITVDSEVTQTLNVDGVNLTFSEFDNVETVKFTMNDEDYTFNFVERDKSITDYKVLIAKKDMVTSVVGIFRMPKIPKYTCELH